MLQVKGNDVPPANANNVVQSNPTVVSIVAHAAATKTRHVDAGKIISAIKTGRWEQPVKEIRSTYAQTLRKTNRKSAKLAVDSLKKKLPAFLPSGKFSSRANDALIQHSGLICADLDSLGHNLDGVRTNLLKSPCLWALFLSPTGDGLKAIFRVSPDPSKHMASFGAIERHVHELTGAQIDQACKDLARLCFVSCDPDLCFNPNAREIAPLPELQVLRHPSEAKDCKRGNLAQRKRIAMELLGDIRWDSEARGFVICPGKHLHTTGDGERDCEIRLDGAPSVHCFHNHCRGILEGTNHELRSQIGKAEFETRLQSIDVRLGGLPVGPQKETDFTSLAKLDYPSPLAEAAYYGVAGEIVRRIEPHTEADPAALLFQILAAFGNLIGHDHYIVADGTRHYLNLYGVLVGQSSKGRKGTSWNHIANLMERVDPDWKQDHISSGLSSGEGLIWAVRDPIEETKPVREKGRHTGEYETFIATHGVPDKRLFVIEPEFASVLTVAARAGNTISPVIRSAWDCGDLKTMVKNSPAKATGAHVSIVGHITRDELRRLLTQTESANGFANRFCWLGVKRSKCLPDGGAIHTVNFEDVVAELHSAVNFAKDFVEIVRDPETKKLWHDVYPRLSAAQPGLSGAIIGRAEAQVMRLAAVYALLDKSRLIRPEHHHAAMAVWRYCEQSAKWIFGASTGDRNADKIVAALRHASNGMTKTEISVQVFNRHASSTDIDEALRLLHGLGMVCYQAEASGGAPIQRWFFVEPSEKSE
jgi:hypothetical protein